MAAKNTKGAISHAEIWDDSALVDSWNDALEEYKVRPEYSIEGQVFTDIS